MKRRRERKATRDRHAEIDGEIEYMDIGIREIERHTDREIERRKTQKHRDIQRHGNTDTQTDRQTDRRAPRI
jgi:hypothetical protein